MKKEQKGELDLASREVADIVADEILKNDDKSNRRFLIFLLIFIILLSFLISSISFAIFNSYDSGSNNTINAGSVLFSFNEGSNYIEILDAYPTSDNVGKSFSKDKEYFDFTVSVGYSKKSRKDKLNYEVTLIPMKENTLSSKYIRVYLTENNKEVIINKNAVNNFSDLENSKIYPTGKVLIRKKANKNMINDYRLRLWLSDKYELSDKSLEFKCKVAVSTYIN